MRAKWASPSKAAIHSSCESTSAPTRWYPGGTCTMAFSSLPTRSCCRCNNQMDLRFLLQASEAEGCSLFWDRTRALLAVNHVGSTARRVTVPAVTTCGSMAPYWASSSKSLFLQETQTCKVLSGTLHHNQHPQKCDTNLRTTRGSSPFRSHSTIWELQQWNKVSVTSHSTERRRMMLPDALVGVPPEGDHFVDLQCPSSVGAAASRLQSAVFHFGHKVFGKGTAYVVVIAILKLKDNKKQTTYKKQKKRFVSNDAHRHGIGMFCGNFTLCGNLKNQQPGMSTSA